MSGLLEIVIKATDACNATCVYCAAGSGPGGRRKLSIETARIILEQATRLVADGRFDRVRLLWHGGEPLLLGKAFFRELAAAAPAPRVTHRIQTNLTLLDPEWIDVLAPLVGPDGVGTSVDPFSDLRRLGGGSEPVRPRTGLPAPWDRAPLPCEPVRPRTGSRAKGNGATSADDYTRQWLRGLALLDEVGWRVGCVYVVHRGSLDRAQDTYWFFRNLRDNARLSLRVNPLLDVGRAAGGVCPDISLRPGDYASFLIALAQTWLSDHRRLVLSPIKDFVAAIEETGSVRACDLAGRAACLDAHLGVDPEGNVYNCGRAVDAGGMRFGNLREVSLRECLDHPSRQVLRDREKTLLADRCGACRYWQLCHGGCLYESHAESERAHRPTVLCEDYQRVFEWLGQRLRTTEREPVRPRTGLRAKGNSASSACTPTPLNLPLTGQEDRAATAVVVGAEQGLDTVRVTVARGTPVALGRLKDWRAEELIELAGFFLHSPTLTVPIEPFYSLFVSLRPGGAACSLPVMYQEQCNQPDPLSACGTCEAFKSCRGFWVYPEPQVDHCDAWRRITSTLRNPGSAVPRRDPRPSQD